METLKFNVFNFLNNSKKTSVPTFPYTYGITMMSQEQALDQ